MDTDPDTPGIDVRRILCIDGGGILGAFPAAFLASIEEQVSAPLHDYFDLIVGTSTGGIIAIGLALGLPASEILKLYEVKGPAIFGQEGSALAIWLKKRARIIRHITHTKYNSAVLKRELEEVLGQSRIGDSRTRLVVPAWNPEARRVYVYKTAHHPRLRCDYKSLAVDAAMSTASAPTYFQKHITENDVGLIDGGVWANNPIAVAVVEAIALLGWPRTSLRILSLGCLDEIYTLPAWGGWGAMNTKLVRLFMDGQAYGAMGMAKLLTGHEHERDAIFRVAHTVNYGTFALDDTRAIRELKGAGFARARERFPALRREFFGRPVEAFVPCYTESLEPSE